MKLLLKGGKLVDPDEKKERESDIYIESGRIKKIGLNIQEEAEVIDAKGCFIFPGLLDLHTHLREPGREDEETIETGTYAAIKGGFTGVVCMPNTQPPIDSEGVVKYILRRAEEVGYARVFPVGAITKGRRGEELTEIGSLVKAGIVALSDDGDPVINSDIMRRALEYSKPFGIPVISHCEDKTLSDGVMNESRISTKLGLRGIPWVAETAMVIRDILLADYTRGRLHIAHVSTRGSVELIRWAKSKGIRVTCETAPHYFTLTDEMCTSFDPNYKVNPPLRTKEDVMAIKEGLRDGTIDCIATDHAPHTISEKEVEFDAAPPGIIGLETALALGYSELVEGGFLSLPELINKFTTSPSKILGIEWARIEEGREANLVLFSPTPWKYDENRIASKSKNSPFIGLELKGEVKLVILGERVFKNAG